MSQTATAPDPEPPDDPTVGGVLVHPLALFTGFVGPAVVYAVSSDEFTRTNAGHALNWQLTATALTFTAVTMLLIASNDATVGGASIELISLPSPIDTVITVVAILLTVAAMIAVTLTFAYAVVATLKAVGGSVWPYPGAVDVVGRLL